MDLRGSWKYIERVSRSRLAHNKTVRHVYNYGENIELIGVAGEIVARRYLGLEEKVHEDFDHGIDMVFGGRTIDVKATRLTPRIDHRYLQWPTWKHIKSDIVLMTAVDIEGKRGTVLGYAFAKDVNNAVINPTRSNPCFEIPVTSLRPAWELIMNAMRVSDVGS